MSNPEAALAVEDLTVAYRNTAVLWDVDAEVGRGTMTCVVGPNGAGKSTFLKACLGLIPLSAGTVTLLGKPQKQGLRQVGYVPQRTSVDWDFPTTVQDVVTMGTYGSLGWFRRPGKAQTIQALAALEQVGLLDFAPRQISELSGGQQQRVFLARALVQNAELYLMDEPFQGVDAATERVIIGLLKDLQARGRTLVVVHHDLQTVPEYFDHVVMLNVRLMAQGPVAEVFTPEMLRKTYGGTMSFLQDRQASRAQEA